MERPSHIIFDTQSHSVSHRLPFVGLALTLQVAAFWLFTYGLASQFISNVTHVIDLVPVVQKTPPPVTPPIPVLKTPTVPVVENPVVKIEQRPSENGITATVIPQTNGATTAAGGADRAPVSIASTHTVPPYPPIARRLGVEGKVTLRLTVSAEGRVSNAEVVASSGRDDLDQTAQQWIMSHWTYKPALDKGVPAVSHALATVEFNLKNER